MIEHVGYVRVFAFSRSYAVLFQEYNVRNEFLVRVAKTRP